MGQFLGQNLPTDIPRVDLGTEIHKLQGSNLPLLFGYHPLMGAEAVVLLTATYESFIIPYNV